jgi:hypothetical protein
MMGLWLYEQLKDRTEHMPYFADEIEKFDAISLLSAI